MVGMSREEVLACAGIPSAKESIGQTEVWQYAGGSVNVGGGLGMGNATASTTGNVTSAMGTTSTIGVSRHLGCQVSIVLTGGHVSAVNYNGSGNLSLCAQPLTNCVHVTQ
jgi:hypothetical protein